MQIIRSPGGSRIGLALAILLIGSVPARADININIGMYDNPAPIVTIAYTASNNSVVSAQVYAGAQKAGELGSTPLYCIDLTHDNYVPTSYTVVPTSTPGTPAIAHSTLEQIAWIVEYADSHYAGSGDVYGRSAAQLLIWSILDPNFKVTNWNGNTGPNSLQAAYNSFTAMLSGPNPVYNSNYDYLGGVQFYNANHGGPNNSYFQDLVIGVPGPFDPTVVGVPEPSTLAIAALGALAFFGHGLRKRGRSVPTI